LLPYHRIADAEPLRDDVKEPVSTTVAQSASRFALLN
jgi:hypothetical protein